MKVTIRKSTGRLIEAQSGNADLAVMIQNATSSGIPPADIDAKTVTNAEFKVLMDAETPAPTPPKDMLDWFNDLSPGRKGQFKAAISQP